MKTMALSGNIFNCISVFFAILVSFSCSDNIGDVQEKIDEARWLNELTSKEYKGRLSGTMECWQVGNYIINELEGMGYTPLIQEFLYRDSLKMRNIYVEIKGINDSICAIGAHYDGAVYSDVHPSANDNASGTVTLLSIAKDTLLRTDKTVLLCFWDGEEATVGSALNGSEYFVDHYDKVKNICWYCNLDGCGRKDSMIYYYYSESLKNRCSALLNEKIGYGPSLNIKEKIQENRASDYASFDAVNIPFWGWTDTDSYQYIHTTDDTAEKISITKIKDVAKITAAIASDL